MKRSEYSKEACRQAVLLCAASLKTIPSVPVYSAWVEHQQKPVPTFGQVLMRLGQKGHLKKWSWTRVLLMCGFDHGTLRQRTEKVTQFDESSCAQGLILCAADLGRTPSKQDYEDWHAGRPDIPSLSTIVRTLNGGRNLSLESALRTAGLETAKKVKFGRNNYPPATPEECREALRLFCTTHEGETPSSYSYESWRRTLPEEQKVPTKKTICRYLSPEFKRWRGALREAGLLVRQYGSRNSKLRATERRNACLTALTAYMCERDASLWGRTDYTNWAYISAAPGLDSIERYLGRIPAKFENAAELVRAQSTDELNPERFLLTQSISGPEAIVAIQTAAQLQKGTFPTLLAYRSLSARASLPAVKAVTWALAPRSLTWNEALVIASQSALAA